MQIRFLLGPAGSGKTFRCLGEIRSALRTAPDGPPLILLAPKQATFQLERQLLSEDKLSGYSRLHILSFERLAQFVFDQLRLGQPPLLDEPGRLMVLRALLTRERAGLKLFHATARLPGFAAQLSLQIRELQRHGFAPGTFQSLADRADLSPELRAKLHDLALLFQAYLRWTQEHALNDLYTLPDMAAAELSAPAAAPFHCAGLWLDGFAEMTPQELNLLAAVVPRCDHASLAFCLDGAPASCPPGTNESFLSHWSAIRLVYDDCRQRLEHLPEAAVAVEYLPRETETGRFAQSSILARLEKTWSNSAQHRMLNAQAGPAADHVPASTLGLSGFTCRELRLVACVDPEAEATLAAREILRFVRNGARYRDAGVIVRDLEAYRQPLERVFRRFQIPCFLDQRESAAHHPLAELTRSTVRTVLFDWQPEDWFGALKTGLVPADESLLDWLENEALARGWAGKTWRESLRLPDKPALEPQAEKLRRTLLPPFDQFRMRLARCQNRPNGAELAFAIRDLWTALNIERQLESWSATQVSNFGFRVSSSIHATVWDQMNDWLDTVALAFSRESLPLSDWLPILESGLADLTVGVVPPALDQVLVGAIDRSRNPDLKLAVVLGLNETVFPRKPPETTLLTEADRDELSAQIQPRLGPDARRRLAQEGFYGYIAFTRARERLVVSYSIQDEAGRLLNPSPFIGRLKQLFPKLETDVMPPCSDWRNSEHVAELIPALLRREAAIAPGLESLPQVRAALDRWQCWQALPPLESLALAPGAVQALYGNHMRSSVSGLEQFAACPFQFFVNYGLRAGERKRFETDPRQTGSFQHEILSHFHNQLRAENKRWRDLSPQQARERIGHIGAHVASGFANGLFRSTASARFLAARLTSQLQDVVEALVGWMKQYEFDPHLVELAFDWTIELGNSRTLLLRGKIDRVDLHVQPGEDAALAVVMDYKSSPQEIDPVFLQHGLDLQLLSYLAALRRLDPKPIFGVARLIPAGVFYVPLRTRAASAPNRREALGKDPALPPYIHPGRFDAAALPLLDNTHSFKGAQFRYAKNKNGAFSKRSNDAMSSADFAQLLERIEDTLRRHGQRILSGSVAAQPYRKGNDRACAYCACQAVCRFDPWVNSFRVLRKLAEPGSWAEADDRPQAAL